MKDRNADARYAIKIQVTDLSTSEVYDFDIPLVAALDTEIKYEETYEDQPFGVFVGKSEVSLLRFDIVPIHDEKTGIAYTVSNKQGE